MAASVGQPLGDALDTVPVKPEEGTSARLLITVARPLAPVTLVCAPEHAACAMPTCFPDRVNLGGSVVFRIALNFDHQASEKSCKACLPSRPSVIT
jgi:hypothetical protein